MRVQRPGPRLGRLSHRSATSAGWTAACWRPTAPGRTTRVTLALAITFPIGYYTNLHHDRTRKAVPDLPVIGALAGAPGPDRSFCCVRRRDVPEPFLPARGADRPRPQQQQHLAAADNLGSAVADPQQPGDSDRRVLLPRPAVPGALGHEVLPLLASVRHRRRRCARDSGDHAVVHRRGGAGRPAQRQLHQSGVQPRGQRHLGRQSSAGGHPARRALHCRRLPRAGQRRIPRQDGLHRDLRRVGQVLRPRAAAAGHRRHQSRQRQSHRRRRDAHRRSASCPTTRSSDSGCPRSSCRTWRRRAWCTRGRSSTRRR